MSAMVLVFNRHERGHRGCPARGRARAVSLPGPVARGDPELPAVLRKSEVAPTAPGGVLARRRPRYRRRPDQGMTSRSESAPPGPSRRTT